MLVKRVKQCDDLKYDNIHYLFQINLGRLITYSKLSIDYIILPRKGLIAGQGVGNLSRY